MSEKTVETSKDFYQYLDVFNAKISEMVTQYGPDTIKLVINVFRVEAIQNLVYGFIGILILTATIYYCLKCFRSLVKKGDEEFSIFLAIPAAIIGIPSFVCATAFFDVFNWIGVFQPEIYIAHKIFDKVL